MANDCDKLLENGGAWEFVDVQQEIDFKYHLLKFFKQNRFASRETAEERAGELGFTIPVDGIPIDADGRYQGTNKSHDFFSDAVVDLLENDVSFVEKFSDRSKRASQVIVDAWVSCQEIKSRKTGGIYTSVKYEGNKASVEVVWYLDRQDDPAPVLKKREFYESLRPHGLTLINHTSFGRDIKFDHGVARTFVINIPEDKLSTRLTITAPLHGNRFIPELKIGLPRIMEPKIQFNSAPTTKELRLVRQAEIRLPVVNDTPNHIYGSLYFWYRFKSKAENLEAAARVRISFRGTSLHDVKQNTDRGSVTAIIEMPARRVALEPNKSEDVLIEWFDVTDNNIRPDSESILLTIKDGQLFSR